MKGHLEELKLGGRPMTKLEKANKEIERLHSIIKEVREWSKKLKYETIQQTTREELLEILDKENK